MMNQYTTHLNNGFRLTVNANNKSQALIKFLLFHPYMIGGYNEKSAQSL